ncbi:citrate synthase [Seinonella peptonophila]|uniref:Citrate synthase n=1 Tax=Seinonella peptonophila TaxID=112248 RepID=A0A1M4W3Q2_9BACL|nr:citrate synthase [Seinonella peptonophila]SHE75868.1 citrate synthase [Seinonella peptonophila]
MSTGKGLEGIVAVESEISSIIDGVLTYRGYQIDELAEQSTFEEVAYLLWNGKLPNESQLAELKELLDQHAPITPTLLKQLEEYPKDAHPMAVLRTIVSALSMYDPDAEQQTLAHNRETAIKLTAQIPTIITALARLRAGKEPVAPKAGLGFAANFLYMLNGEEPTFVAAHALDKALILHADHELNASTFAARVTTGTLSDMYSAITTAIGTLKGPLHGGANEQVMATLREIGNLDKIDAYIENKLANKEKIMGFGHRVYKNGDPRAKHLREMSRQLAAQIGDTLYYDMSTRIEELVTQKKGLKPNVDFYSASVYNYLGISGDLFTPIFAMSRVVGWTAHVLEQLEHNRLIRPRAEYIGPMGRRYEAIEHRR